MRSDEALKYRNVTAAAMLRHVRIVTKNNTVQLWLGDTHIANVEPDSIAAIALQAFAADQPDALRIAGEGKAPERPKYQPPQVTLLEAAEALLTKLETSTYNSEPMDKDYRWYGEADVLRQAIQREKAK